MAVLKRFPKIGISAKGCDMTNKLKFTPIKP